MERAIGGVESRRVILEELLEGEKTGLELRYALARSFGVTLDEVSDARLYHNLIQLEEAGIITRRRDWKVKYAQIKPNMIQAVREYLGVKAPVIYIGGLEDDPYAIRGVKQLLKERSRVNPEKYIFLGSVNYKNKISGITEDVELMFLPEKIVQSSFDGVYEAVKNIVEKHNKTHEIVFDVTRGTRFTAMAFYGIAYEYNLKCFYIVDGNRIIWIH